jgi:hypothetical protein
MKISKTGIWLIVIAVIITAGVAYLWISNTPVNELAVRACWFLLLTGWAQTNLKRQFKQDVLRA